VTRMNGLARLCFSESTWIAVPSEPGLADDPLSDPAWWLEVPTRLLQPYPGIREGALVCVGVDVDSGCNWSPETPTGVIGEVRELRRFSAGDLSPAYGPGEAENTEWDPVRLDNAVAEALDRIPANWPVYEIQGARPEVSGWHTRVKTLCPVDGLSKWRGKIPSSLLQVVPWLTPIEVRL
jgi:hypothetical protein